MAPGVVRLPNGYNLTVTPVFGGLYFKSLDANTQDCPFPPGWTIFISTQDEPRDEDDQSGDDLGTIDPFSGSVKRKHHVHAYRKPTLQNDHLFFSSISNPASSESKSKLFPASSPTRQIAMMLWATLYWYFHQPEPDARMINPTSKDTPEDGRPRGEWRLNISREGIFKGRQLMQKLEHMGLIATEETSVGLETDPNTPEGWSKMFVSRRHFWQLDPRIYLFTLSPQVRSSAPGEPLASSSQPRGHKSDASVDKTPTSPTAVRSGLWQPPGQFKSSSHLPTYYPPAPAQYIFTNNVRHPLRPKAQRQGETFYTRYIASLDEYLSFRVASSSSRPIFHAGPVAKPALPSGGPALPNGSSTVSSPSYASDSHVPTLGALSHDLTDSELLHRWMNDPRVAYSWGEEGPLSHQEEFLKHNLQSRHSFPVIGLFDGQPFGYFEIYWVKEDRLGSYLGGNVNDWDRGIHVLVGEQSFRGPHRVKVWLSALVHLCFLADSRTECVMLEPRVDNVKLKRYCEDVGFFKEREISFPHKQSNLMKIRRDAWTAPAI
ncbi:hypothetical protein AAFC00_004959 [Neodothiora populina]|uniref:Acyltransferase MbtK/IucB-like conserved domain-containing protein n=1 Tax=Neodothiora populina TaxID=2781224 RepID=A0ABR3P546_9PEZI